MKVYMLENQDHSDEPDIFVSVDSALEAIARMHEKAADIITNHWDDDLIEVTVIYQDWVGMYREIDTYWITEKEVHGAS